MVLLGVSTWAVSGCLVATGGDHRRSLVLWVVFKQSVTEYSHLVQSCYSVVTCLLAVWRLGGYLARKCFTTCSPSLTPRAAV